MADETPTADVSLDFQYNDIWYTIVDEAAKTCKTKDGSVIQDGNMSKFVFGNTVTGNVTIPDEVVNGDNQYSVIAIGNLGFSGPTEITLPSTLTEIGSYAFINCTQLKSIDIPSTVTSIGNHAFYGCTALSSVNLPESITTIPLNCFTDCKSLRNINLPETLTSIGEKAFARSGLMSIMLPNSLTEIGAEAFDGCTALANINFPDNLTAIPASAFYYCTSLTSINLPESITQIGSYAFNHCTALREITCRAFNPPAISGDTFGATQQSSITLNVYNTSLQAYKSNSLWKIFGNYMAIPVEATGISLDKTSLQLYEGISGQLKAILEPAYTTQPVVWSIVSTPNGAAIINDSGKVTGEVSGSAVVTATCGSYSATCDVTIVKNPDAYVKINPITSDIYVGDVMTFTAKVFPSSITYPLEWSSSNTGVATINSSTGELEAIYPGATVVTATCGDLSAKYAITVNPIEATGVILNQATAVLTPGETVTLTATVQPSNTTIPTVVWTSNDETVATVAEGVVTAINPGQATITATCGLITATCSITVNAIPATSIELSDNNITLRATQSQQLTATVMPENATDKTITWTSDNESIATVSLDGTVTAIAVGSATITATCGDISSTCTVTVSPTPAEEVVISMVATTMRAGQIQQLTAAVPDNTTDKTIIWSSDNPQIADVSSEGLITAYAVGTAIITASCGDVSATCTVTVEATPAEQIILSETALTVNVGDNTTLQAQVLPETTTDATITWTSDNPSIASVDNGIVTANAPGSAVIFATCGNITGSCNVTVLNPAKAITLNYTELTLTIGEIEDLIETIEPANTTDIVVWTSSNTDVAVVDENGIVQALSEGTTVITATCGEVSADCTVTVIKQDDNEPEVPDNPDDPSSIDNISADSDGYYRVYNLNGVNVLNTKDKNNINDLPRGIYIVNRMKIFIQ